MPRTLDDVGIGTGLSDIEDAQAFVQTCPRCGKAPRIADAGPGWGYMLLCQRRKKCPEHLMRCSGQVANVVRKWNDATASP